MTFALNKKHSHSRPSAGKAPLFFKKPLFRGFFLICHSRDQRKLHKKGQVRSMTNPLFQRNLVSINDLTRAEMELIVDTAARLKTDPRPNLLANKVVASCFFEASTRTRLSFETAVHRLGGSVIGFADGKNTSLGQKGETHSRYLLLHRCRRYASSPRGCRPDGD